MTIETDLEEGYCPVCNGSGEGLYDGSTCISCRGCGYVLLKQLDSDNQEYFVSVRRDRLSLALVL